MRFKIFTLILVAQCLFQTLNANKHEAEYNIYDFLAADDTRLEEYETKFGEDENRRLEEEKEKKPDTSKKNSMKEVLEKKGMTVEEAKQKSKEEEVKRKKNQERRAHQRGELPGSEKFASGTNGEKSGSQAGGTNEKTGSQTGSQAGSDSGVAGSSDTTAHSDKAGGSSLFLMHKNFMHRCGNPDEFGEKRYDRYNQCSIVRRADESAFLQKDEFCRTNLCELGVGMVQLGGTNNQIFCNPMRKWTVYSTYAEYTKPHKIANCGTFETIKDVPFCDECGGKIHEPCYFSTIHKETKKLLRIDGICSVMEDLASPEGGLVEICRPWKKQEPYYTSQHVDINHRNYYLMDDANTAVPESYKFEPEPININVKDAIERLSKKHFYDSRFWGIEMCCDAKTGYFGVQGQKTCTPVRDTCRDYATEELASQYNKQPNYYGNPMHEHFAWYSQPGTHIKRRVGDDYKYFPVTKVIQIHTCFVTQWRTVTGVQIPVMVKSAAIAKNKKCTYSWQWCSREMGFCQMQPRKAKQADEGYLCKPSWTLIKN